MKLASLMASLILLASFAQAKDRYLVIFKSEQGYKAMSSYLNTEAANSGIQESLQNVQAIVLKTKNTALLNSLKNHPEVSLVEPEMFHPVPKPVNGFKMQIARVDYFEAARRKKRNPLFDTPTQDDPTATPELIAGAATPWGILAVHAGDAWAQSAAGAKSRVMVLDTGIDQDHPAISANFEKGKNFVAEDDGRVIDSKYQDTEGHGTHCSGTILGVYNQQTGFTGVAPKAKLLMGRVCGAQGCSSVGIVQGINWGIQEKVDVISMSLGGPVGSSAERAAVEKADKAGVVVVAASGNGADAPDYSPNKNDAKCNTGGFFSPNNCGVSFPGAFPTVVAVGALNSDLVKTNFSQWGPELDVTGPGAAVISSVPRGTGRDSKVTVTINGTETSVKSSAFGGTELFATPVANSLVAVPGVGKPEDFAKVDVAGKFALVSRGEIKFADKVTNAIAAKAAGVIIYNNTAGLMQGSLSEDGSLINMPVVMIEKEQGLALVAELTKGSAVGASVATLPADYASFDGTSMATPHVAGVVALIRSANKKLTPAQVRAILYSTAKPLAPNDTNQYGAGIVQADAAVAKAVAQ
jgi:serine protease